MQGSTKTRSRLAAAAVALSLAAPLAAQEIFRTEDEHGVVSFSDVAAPGAEVLTFASAPVAADTFDRQQRIIDQQLAVAKALEESRLAREAARTERLRALANSRPPVVYVQERTRYLGGFKRYLWHPGYPGHPGKPGVRPPHPVHPIEPPGGDHRSRLNPPSRTVPLPPLKSGQNPVFFPAAR